MRVHRTLLLFLGANFLAVLAAIPVLIAEGALRIADRPHPSSAAADRLATAAGASWRAVSLSAYDGTRLEAWYFTPAKPNHGAVLLLHGVADTRLGVLNQAEFLLRDGFAALLPDSRGHGSSGGVLVTYGLREARDVACWQRWLASQPGIERTYGLGVSLGASVLLQSLSFHPGFLAIVADCPFARFSEIASYRVTQHAPAMLRFAAQPVTAIAAWYARARYGIDLMQASPIAAVAQTTTPVLLIHGSADANIPPRQSRELHDANPRSTELWIVPGAGHTAALSTEPQEYRRRVQEWFSR